MQVGTHPRQAVIDGASQFILASVDLNQLRTFQARKTVALLTKFRRVRGARAWEAGHSKAQRTFIGKGPLAAVLVLDLERVGTEPNGFHRETFENVRGHVSAASRATTGVGRRYLLLQQPRTLETPEQTDCLCVAGAQLFDRVLRSCRAVPLECRELAQIAKHLGNPVVAELATQQPRRHLDGLP